MAAVRRDQQAVAHTQIAHVRFIFELKPGAAP
jgi:hypothetical protein